MEVLSNLWMIIYALICLVLTVAYLFIIWFYRFYWRKIPTFDFPEDFEPSISVSIVIAARNEANNIKSCLNSLAELNYPSHLFEIIVVDDHSEDDTAGILREYDLPQLHLIQLAESQTGKKAAISTAIAKARGTLIVSTDADCIVPPQWLMLITAFFEQYEPKFIAAPVIFDPVQNTLEYFQALDFSGMMVITGAGIQSGFMHMSNGANLAYPKAIFEELEGFKNIDRIASGDDILFMQKVAHQYPEQIKFLKHPHAIVKTLPEGTLRDFISQRIRWGTKSTQYKDWQITAVLAIVFFYCWNIIFSFMLIPIFGRIGLLLFGLQFFSKLFIDYFFLRQASSYFNRPQLMKYFFSAQFLHIGYIAFIGVLSNIFKTYTWKSRKGIQ